MKPALVLSDLHLSATSPAAVDAFLLYPNYRGMIFDDQPQTVQLDVTVTPTPVNPLGAKGVGEAGTLGSTPAVVNAAVDALSEFGVTHIDMMLRPEKLWRIIHRGHQGHHGQGGRS